MLPGRWRSPAGPPHFWPAGSLYEHVATYVTCCLPLILPPRCAGDHEHPSCIETTTKATDAMPSLADDLSEMAAYGSFMFLLNELRHLAAEADEEEHENGEAGDGKDLFPAPSILPPPIGALPMMTTVAHKATHSLLY